MPGGRCSRWLGLTVFYFGGLLTLSGLSWAHALTAGKSLAANKKMRKLGAAQARDTGQEEQEAARQLFQRLSVLVMEDNTATLNNSGNMALTLKSVVACERWPYLLRVAVFQH